MNKLSILTWLVLIVGLGLFRSGSVSAQTTAKLWIEPGEIKMVNNEVSTAKVWLETGEKNIIGVDLVLKYDPVQLSVVDVGSEGVFGSVTGRKIDNVLGITRLSLSNNFGVFTKGKKSVAWIKFKTFGKTELKWDFVKGKTNETNVVAEHGVDVLESVTDMNLINFSNTVNSSREEKTITLVPTVKIVGEVKGESTQATLVKKTMNWEIIVLGFGGIFVVAGLWLCNVKKND